MSATEAHSCLCNQWAIHDSLKGQDFELPLVLNCEELPSGGENAGRFAGPRPNQSARGTLNRNLSIPSRLIFASSVCVGRASLAAAPVGPEIRPRLSASAASIISLSWLRRASPSATVEPATRLVDSRLNQVSSTEKVSSSLKIMARSITFCSSRTLPGQP